MVDVARHNASQQGIVNVSFAQSTLFDEKLKPESFDVVLAINILHLLEDTSQFIHRICELMKPGGLFISATACLGEKQTFMGFVLPLLSKIGLVPYVRKFSVAELESAIVQGGFRIVEAELLPQTLPNDFVIAKKRSTN